VERSEPTNAISNQRAAAEVMNRGILLGYVASIIKCSMHMGGAIS